MQTAQTYSSRFGGLWVDQTDPGIVAARLQAIPDEMLRVAFRTFIRNGYAVLRGAVSHAAIDAYLREYRHATATRDDLQMDVPLEGGRQAFDREHVLTPGSKVLDVSMLLPGGRALTFAPAIVAFLSVLFDGPALATQTLHFEVGSTQAVHQDTAYVVVEGAPLKLAASWIALEDIQPGTGELIYYPGGHRIREHVYAGDNGAGGRKHWDPPTDGNAPHDAHLDYIQAEAARRGWNLISFQPRKGDVLIWHADLPHGGGPISRTGTRRSLVSHYCPISEDPRYLQFIPEEWRRKVPAGGGDAYCSLYFPPEMLAGV